jgi:hypothetical protein
MSTSMHISSRKDTTLDYSGQGFLPRAKMDVTNKNAGQGNVNEAQLDNLEGRCGSYRDGLVQGDPNGQVDVGSGFHNNWIGF